jgi:polysaccharide deacetylase 2 family uncharacterized protein YibQ
MLNGLDPEGRWRRAVGVVIILIVVGVGSGIAIGRWSAPRQPPVVIEAHSTPADQAPPIRSEALPRPPDQAMAPSGDASDIASPAPASVTPTPVPQAVEPNAKVAIAPPPKPLVTGAWRDNARPTPELGPTPVIALIIDDVGPDRRGSQRAIDLPGAVTLSLLPYAADIGKLAARARSAGHEIMVHLPMEPIGDSNPGPDAITAGMQADELAGHLERALSAFTGAVGLNNHMGSKATQDEAVMRAVMEALRARGMLFVDSRTTGRTVGLEAATAIGVPAIGRDVFIDDDPSPIQIERQLTATEALARRKGFAVAIAHPRAGSLDIIERWLGEVQQRGVILVPISELVRRQISLAQAG